MSPLYVLVQRIDFLEQTRVLLRAVRFGPRSVSSQPGLGLTSRGLGIGIFRDLLDSVLLLSVVLGLDF